MHAPSCVCVCVCMCVCTSCAQEVFAPTGPALSAAVFSSGRVLIPSPGFWSRILDAVDGRNPALSGFLKRGN